MLSRVLASTEQLKLDFQIEMYLNRLQLQTSIVCVQ